MVVPEGASCYYAVINESMKATKLTIKNIGILEDVVVKLDKPLLIFYGEIRQGKTSILNAVKWVFGGTFPTDIIRQGETEALVRLDLDCGAITRSFYVSKDGSTKARPVIFDRDGIAVKDPVAEIKKFLNPFLLDQNHIVSMTELERKKYFASLFAVDTEGIDKEITTTEANAVQMRAKLKAYGEIDLTPVEAPVNLEELQHLREKIINAHKSAQIGVANDLAKSRADYQAAQQEVHLKNSAIRENNFQVNAAVAESQTLYNRIAKLKVELGQLQGELEGKTAWLKDRDIQKELPAPAALDTSLQEAQLSAQPDTAEIDALLRKSEADKVRLEQYVRNQARQREREQDEARIVALDATVRELRAKKIAKLQELSNATGIPGLVFDEAGNFSFEGSNAGMLSTSQIMRLSSMLSALYPEGFGIELLDRGESLGRSIFEFIDRAAAERKTILAAVVGEVPATVPEQVGVFIVSDGRVQ